MFGSCSVLVCSNGLWGSISHGTEYYKELLGVSVQKQWSKKRRIGGPALAWDVGGDVSGGVAVVQPAIVHAESVSAPMPIEGDRECDSDHGLFFDAGAELDDEEAPMSEGAAPEHSEPTLTDADGGAHSCTDDEEGGSSASSSSSSDESSSDESAKSREEVVQEAPPEADAPPPQLVHPDVDAPCGLQRSGESHFTYLWADPHGCTHRLVLRQPSKTQPGGGWFAICGFHPAVGLNKCTRTMKCSKPGHLLNLHPDVECDTVDTEVVTTLQTWLAMCHEVGPERGPHMGLPR